jgi:methylenetetrahydrofolate dehydrogenase (NAD+)
VPSPKYKLPTEWIKPGAVVVNVASCKNVNEEELMQVGLRLEHTNAATHHLLAPNIAKSQRDRADVQSVPPDTSHHILQVPGVVYVPLVGKVTVAMLERNLMRLYENYHREEAPGRNFRYYIESRPAKTLKSPNGLP